MEDYMPQIVEENVAEIQMPNPWQLTQMQKALPQLIKELHRSLSNNMLQIRLTLAKYDAEQMAFTAEEKYKLMADTNPAIQLLKEKLDLQID